MSYYSTVAAVDTLSKDEEKTKSKRKRAGPEDISLEQISFQNNEEKRILLKIPVTGRLYTAWQCALAQTSRWGSAQLSSHHGGGIIFTSTTPTALDTTLKSNVSQYTSSRESSTQYGNVHCCLKGRDRLSSCHIIMVVVRSSLWILQWIMLVCEIYGHSDGQSWRFFWFEPFT